jgi:hypothetical protein
MLRLFAWVLVLLTLTTGCAKTPPPIVEVHGVVRLDGVPLSNVEVRFFPGDEFGSEYVAKGITDEAGRFTLMCKGLEGACTGENHVIVADREIPTHLLSEHRQRELAEYKQKLGPRPPPRYGNLVDSPLKVNVQVDQKEYEMSLTTK